MATQRRRQLGQVATEWLMIAGIMTAMLILLGRIIVPTVRYITVVICEHVVVYISSPASS